MRRNEPRKTRKCRPRPLGFEQLETKAALSSLFFDCEAAPTLNLIDPAEQAAACIAEGSSPGPLLSEDLLRFIEEHAAIARSAPWTSPTPAECAHAEHMLLVHETELRTLSFAETLELN